MPKKKINIKKIIKKPLQSEHPIIDQSADLMKKLLVKGKKNGFLSLGDIENSLSNESSEVIEEFQAKIISLGIQIHESEEEIADDDSKNAVVGYKEEDPGKTDDPVRMYLKEMGSVELLSRQGEIEIAKNVVVK